MVLHMSNAFALTVERLLDVEAADGVPGAARAPGWP